MAQNRRMRKKGRIARIGAALLVLTLLVGFILLFKVRKIQVYGNERHSSEEISSCLLDDVFMKNTVYMLWKYREGKLPENMPFLETMHIQMKSPSRIEVHVTEKKPVAYLEKNGFACFDQEGIVLEISDQAFEGLPIVTGAAVEEPTLYQKLPAQSSAQLRTILSLAELMAYQGVAADEIRFSDNMEITIFAGGIKIQLGQDEYLEEKVANLAKILPRLEGESGTLHLEGFTGRNEQVPFTPTGVGASGDVDAGSEEGIFGDGRGDNENGDADAGDGAGGDAGDGSGGEAGDGSGGDAGDDTGGDAGGDADGGDGNADAQSSGTVYPMVFNSSGTLVYNVHVENGTVVDEYGNPVPGVTINENGNVVDAYMNEFDSATGELIQQ